MVFFNNGNNNNSNNTSDLVCFLVLCAIEPQRMLVVNTSCKRVSGSTVGSNCRNLNIDSDLIFIYLFIYLFKQPILTDYK